MTGRVLTWSLMSDLDETFTENSETISRSLRNVHILQDSRKDLNDRLSLDMIPDVRS